MERKKPVDGQVGARLMQLRQARGMSRRELAAAIGVTQRMVRYYEQGSVRLTVERLADFAGALRCRPTDFLIPMPASPTRRGRAEADHSR